MSESLLPCASCHRHLRASSSRCPCCDAPFSRAASGLAHALRVGAALAVVGATPSEALAQSPRELLAQAPATAYGAPPTRDPLGPGVMPQRVPRSVPAVSVRVRGQELRGPVSEAAARRELSAAWPLLRRCVSYVQDEMGGELRASVRVSTSGRVANVTLIGGGTPRLRGCVIPVLLRMNLGAPRGAVTVAFVLAA